MLQTERFKLEGNELTIRSNGRTVGVTEGEKFVLLACETQEEFDDTAKLFVDTNHTVAAYMVLPVHRLRRQVYALLTADNVKDEDGALWSALVDATEDELTASLERLTK